MKGANRSLTDRELSVDAEEFVWNESGLSEVHVLLLDRVADALSHHGASSVLDIGCGNGAASAELARRGFDVTGLDASTSGIALARAQPSSARFDQYDLSDPLPSHLIGDFDAVLAIEVIEHLFKPRLLLERAALALRPGGMLLLTTPYHGYWKNLAIAAMGKFDSHVHPLRDYGHIKFFSEKTMGQLVRETGFRIREIHRVGRIPILAKSMVVSAVLEK